MTVFFSLNWHLRLIYEVFSPRNFHQFHSDIKYPMRDEEFLKKLTEVCEWEIPLDPDHNQSGQHNRKKKLEKLGVNCFNQTYPPRIVKLKLVAKPCEDCGKIVEGRRKELRAYHYGLCHRFKENCVTCGLHKSPYTDQFTCDSGTEASRLWTDYARYHTHRKQSDK